MELSDLKTIFLNIFFPPFCIFCDKVMDFRATFFVCDECKTYSDKFLTNDGCYQLVDIIRDSVLRFKNKGRIDYAQTMGTHMAQQFLKRHRAENFDVVVSMPIDKRSFKKRGFKQEELLAKTIAKRLNLPSDNKTLRYSIDTSPNGEVPVKKRQKYLFTITNSETLKNKHVLLVDDFRETGASIRAATEVLMEQAGAKHVAYSVFAIADERCSHRVKW